jgi:hypothetical protein
MSASGSRIYPCSLPDLEKIRSRHGASRLFSSNSAPKVRMGEWTPADWKFFINVFDPFSET